MTPSDHLLRAVEACDRELTGALGDDWLVIACARLLFALQRRERQQAEAPTPEPQERSGNVVARYSCDSK